MATEKTLFSISKNAAKRKRQHARIQQRSSSTEGRLPPQVVFHRRSSSIEGRLPRKVVIHGRSSSNSGSLPPKVVFHRRLSSIEGRLPTEAYKRPKIFLDTLTTDEQNKRMEKAIYWGRMLPKKVEKGKVFKPPTRRVKQLPRTQESREICCPIELIEHSGLLIVYYSSLAYVVKGTCVYKSRHSTSRLQKWLQRFKL